MAMRAFAGIDLAVEAVPDATTLLNLRRMLVALELTRRLFDEIGISQGIHPRSHMIATKACPIVLRSRHGIVHILAFKHPAAGYQLVKGTIEQGESSPEAAIRELCEESGICDAHVVSDLGLWNASYQEQIWSFQLCESRAELPDEWTFETSDDGGRTFAFYWHPLQRNLPEQCHPLFQSALREVRVRIGALTRSA